MSKETGTLAGKKMRLAQITIKEYVQYKPLSDQYEDGETLVSETRIKQLDSSFDNILSGFVSPPVIANGRILAGNHRRSLYPPVEWKITILIPEH